MDGRAIGRALLFPAFLWLAIVAVFVVLGYPGIIYATPAGWLLALAVGRVVIIRSRSSRLRVRLAETAIAGGLLGLAQGGAFLVGQLGLPGTNPQIFDTGEAWGLVIMVAGVGLCAFLSTAIGARTDRMRRQRSAGDLKLEVTSQYCPICKQPVPLSMRYPRAVCNHCASQAEDENGKAVVFFNESLSGGVAGLYRDTNQKYPEHVCFIKGIACRVEESYLGGIVIYPQD